MYLLSFAVTTENPAVDGRSYPATVCMPQEVRVPDKDWTTEAEVTILTGDLKAKGFGDPAVWLPLFSSPVPRSELEWNSVREAIHDCLPERSGQ